MNKPSVKKPSPGTLNRVPPMLGSVRPTDFMPAGYADSFKPLPWLGKAPNMSPGIIDWAKAVPFKK